MKLDQLLPSKYLKQSDVPEEKVVTIRDLKKTNVAREDEDPEYKYVIFFREFDKGMVLNATNIKRLGKALGDDTDNWTDGQVILYVDPDIEFGGNVTGGLRFRAMQRKAAPAARKSVDDINADLNDPPF